VHFPHFLYPSCTHPADIQKPPRTQAELQAEIERLRNERMGRRDVASAAAPESSVLASVQESRGQDWAAGEKRLV
jgi:hypothetical protein